MVLRRRGTIIFAHIRIIETVALSHLIVLPDAKHR